MRGPRIGTRLSFIDLFNEALRASGRRHPETPGRALEEWSDFVEDCREGYSASLFEYWNDLSIRRFLQTIIEAPAAVISPDAAWFIAEVTQTDQRFKEVIEGGLKIPGRWGWWEQTIPRISGEIMAADVMDGYGFEIQVV